MKYKILALLLISKLSFAAYDKAKDAIILKEYQVVLTSYQNTIESLGRDFANQQLHEDCDSARRIYIAFCRDHKDFLCKHNLLQPDNVSNPDNVPKNVPGGNDDW